MIWACGVGGTAVKVKLIGQGVHVQGIMIEMDHLNWEHDIVAGSTDLFVCIDGRLLFLGSWEGFQGC